MILEKKVTNYRAETNGSPAYERSGYPAMNEAS